MAICHAVCPGVLRACVKERRGHHCQPVGPSGASQRGAAVHEAASRSERLNNLIGTVSAFLSRRGSAPQSTAAQRAVIRVTYLNSCDLKLAVAEPESIPLRRYPRPRKPYVSVASALAEIGRALVPG